MKRFTYFILSASTLLMPVPSHSEVRLEPYSFFSFGYTKYRMQVTEPIANPPPELSNATSVGQSELQYPLDMTFAGLRLEVSPDISQSHIRFFLSSWVNLNNPASPMLDSDWFGIKQGSSTTLYKFSYTESDSKVRWYGAEAGVETGRLFLLGKPINYGVKLEIDYGYFEMFGITGWRKLPDEAQRTPVDTLRNTQVLTYKVYYLIPTIYSKFLLSQQNSLTWSVLLGLSPFSIAIDEDDHVIRNKEAKTTAYGLGAEFTNTLTYQFSDSLAAELGLRIRYVRNSGKMSQYYYGDDPGTDEDETGKSFNDIENVLSLFTQEIYLGVSWQF